jgi:hypothetical protein
LVTTWSQHLVTTSATQQTTSPETPIYLAFAALVAIAEANPLDEDEDEDDDGWGRVSERRRAHRFGKLDETVKKELEALPGWRW